MGIVMAAEKTQFLGESTRVTPWKTSNLLIRFTVPFNRLENIVTVANAFKRLGTKSRSLQTFESMRLSAI